MLSMIVLAGGHSSRMGTDKSDLLYRNQTFLNIQIQKGKELGIQDILVSGYRGVNCKERIVIDRLEGRGPLGGLETCLRQAVYERCLVVSVDTPLLSVSELKKLIAADAHNQQPVTILRHGIKEEPLIGVYAVWLADAMTEKLEQGRYSVFGFLNKIGYGIYHSQGSESQFGNINDMADYEKLLTGIPVL